MAEGGAHGPIGDGDITASASPASASPASASPEPAAVEPATPEAAVVDYRFILANERTFLAWMRTALGLVAGGVALDQFVAVAERSPLLGVLAIGIIALGAIVAIVGILMWRRTDAAMFEGRPLPRTRAVPLLGVLFVVLAVAVAIALTVVD